jgi:hypothetical protein
LAAFPLGVLSYDRPINRIRWTLLVTAFEKPVPGCTIRFGGEILRWEGTGGKELDIGAGGAGQVQLHDMDYDPTTTVTVKSGPFTIYRRSFNHLEDICLTC